MSSADGMRAERGGRSFALPVEDFIADKAGASPPLIGSSDDCILPAYGLLLFVAKGGKGKTTAMLDALLHLASGQAWLGFEVPRPLRILLIENEGPREPFRRKLERRISHWPHPLTGAIYVYSEDWGQARLDERDFIERFNHYVSKHEIDLVVGDPLDTLGMEGSGSPKDTREMVEHLKRAGLFTRTAWWILHHARKGRVGDSIDEASGSWGGKPDALLGLERLPGGKARLSFHKLRWARRDGFSYMLDYDPESEAFELLGEDSRPSNERDYVKEIAALLEDGEWRTTREVSARTQGGIGASRKTVEEALVGNPLRFVSRTGDAARQIGRSSNATVWSLAREPRPVGPVIGSKAEMDSLASGSSRREPEPASQSPATTGKLAQNCEPDGGRSGCPSHRDSPAKGCRYCRATSEEAVK